MHNLFLPTNFLQANTPESFVGYSIRIFLEGVPIFVAISGFLLLPRETQGKKILLKIKKMLLLIVIWFVLYSISLKLLYGQSLNLRNSILDFLRLNSSNSQAGFLWYLQSLIGVYLLLPIISYIYRNNQKLYHYLTAIVVICSAGINTVMLLITPIASLLGMKELPSAIQTFMSAYAPLHEVSFLSFFLIGSELYIFRDQLKTQKAKKYALISLIMSIVICIAYGITIAFINPGLYKEKFVYGSMPMLIILASIYTLTQNFQKNGRISRFICQIGENSLGIYLLHFFIIHICRFFGITTFLSQAPWGIGVFFENIAILMIAYMVTILLKRIPCIQKLFML